jgi:hypothetical protein
VATSQDFINYLASKPKTGGSSRGTSRSSSPLTKSQIDNFNKKKSSSGSNKSLEASKKKLADSILAIQGSNAPEWAKADAAKYSTKPKKSDDSLLDTIKGGLGTGVAGLGQILAIPQTLLTQPIRRVIDPKRNLLKDIISGETTSSALAGADWFKGLPAPARIAIGISSDIATDPLTYLLGAGLISKIGQAPGIIQKIDKAADVLRAAGRVDDATRLVTFGGNLARKGKGGIGGIKNADLTWIGKTLEETGVVDLGGKALKGGLYFQPPGTGRVANFASKKLGGSGIDSAKYQVYLGRGPVVEKISAGASNTMNRFKTSKLMSTLGDAYGGGEGQLKRKILNAESPQEALNLRRNLVSDRVENGVNATIMKMHTRKALTVDKIAEKAGVDRTIIVGALDGNKDDILELDSLMPGGSALVRRFDDELITDTTAQITRVVESFGGDLNDVAPLVERAKDHLHGVLTDEALEGMNVSKKAKYANKGVDGFAMPSKFVPGANHLGAPIGDVEDQLTRAFIIGEDGRQYILLGEVNKPAVAMAAEHGTGETAEQFLRSKIGETLEGNARASKEVGTDGPVTLVRYLDENDKIVSAKVATDDIKFQQVDPTGLGAKTQVNAINRAKYGHDLFSTDYRKIVQNQIYDFAKAAGEEVRGLYLKKYGLAVSKGEDQSVASAIAAQRGIVVSADAAADPAFKTAVVANVDDPAKVQVAAIAANGAADARTSLPTEPADFSVLSLTPEEAKAHFTGAVEDAKIQAEVLASRTSKTKSGQVQNLEDSIGRTEARISLADEQIDRIDTLINEAGQSSVGGVASGVDSLEVSELKSIRESILVNKQSDADSLRMLTGRSVDEAKYLAWTKSGDAQQGFADAVLDGWVSISRHTQAPEQVAEVMTMLAKATGPDELPGLFRYFDKLTNLFKSWAIASPGFVMRNGMGGMFNNYLIGVDAGRYWEFIKADRAFTTALKRTGDVEQALAAVPKRFNRQYRLLHSSGVLAETDRASDAVFGLNKSLGQGDSTRDAFGWLGNNFATRGVYDVNSRMERVLRGAAGMDAAAKTDSLDGIYESVFKAHFDYSDLNRFEVNRMKRVSPFYTWTRKNLPLQMEMLFKNPKAYNRYNIFKKNIESVTPEEDLVPTWMKDRLNIRLPFTSKDGQMYILPDLPFTSLNMFTNVDELAGQINPVIKTPVELLMNRKMYFGKSAPFKEGYVQMPDMLTKTGIAQAMYLVGLAERDIDGKFLTRDKTLYAAEQFLPFFGRMRRLLPSEKKYDERAVTTWINFLFGTGLRTNTMTDRSSEIYYRQRSVDDIAKDLNSLGYGGYTYWDKRVETSRKPKDTDKRPYLTLNQPKGGLPYDSPYTNVSGSNAAAVAAITRMKDSQK